MDFLRGGGHRYYMVFLDDFTNFLWTYPISNKSQGFLIFTTFSNYIQTQFDRKIKQFQCDNGKEYANSQFQQYCTQHGMHFHFSCPHTSSQNGKAEQKIRTINNVIRTLLAHSSLPNTYWHHVLDVATYHLNILPSKLPNYQSPTECLYFNRPSYDHLRVFGCLCYPLIPYTTINKLEHRSMPCVFLGYPPNHRGYKCLNLATKKIIINRHVIFYESTFPLANNPKPSLHSYDFLTNSLNPIYWTHIQPFPSSNNPPPNSSGPDPPTSGPNLPTSPIPSNNPTTPSDTPGPLSPNPITPPPSTPTQMPPTIRTYSRRPKPSTTVQLPTAQSQMPTSPQNIPHPPPPPPTQTRTIRTRSMDGITKPRQPFNLHTIVIIPLPKTPKEALSAPDWYNAMTTEFNALIKNQT
ncbi:putative RNA-directed DNA polymerase [Helianthus annuus]|nr:putative RNA-directed DNA polymerase [Helianthus annuus]